MPALDLLEPLDAGQLFDHMMEGFALCEIILDSEGAPCDFRYLRVNPAFEGIVGLKQQEVAGRTARDLFPGVEPMWLEVYAKVALDGTATRFGAWFEPLKRYFEVSAYSPCKGRFAAVFLDVTDRKRTEKAFAESEERHRLLVENCNDLLSELDMEGRYLYVSPNHTACLGYEPAELLGTRGFDLVHPDDLPKLVEKFTLPMATATFRCRHKDGTWRWVESTAQLFSQTFEGETHSVVICRDITERRKEEQRFRQLSGAVEHSPVSVVITDTKGNIEYVNPKFTQVTGYTLEEAVGQNPRILKSGELSCEFYENLWNTITRGDEWHGEFHNRKKNGELYWEAASISPITDEHGAITHFVAVKEDITERKRMDEQVLRSQRMESIGTLAGGVAHDLNNILAPIVMSAELLYKETDPGERRQIIGIIEACAKRGADIVQQVVTFARGMDGEHTIVQPRHLANDLETMMRETFPRLITIVNNMPRDLRPVTGDATQLHQVLLNLCINARDAMPHGGTLILTGQNVELDPTQALMMPEAEPGSYTVLEVKDTGMGIPKDIIGKIFDPFFTTKEVGKGTGLGLSTLIGIVKSHRGFVNVQSEVNRGSTFKVYLPADTGAEAPPGQQNLPLIPAAAQETILVVEDETAIRNVTETVLTRNGYKVLTASNGAEAVAVYAAHSAEIKVVLTDVMMPMLDGINLSRVIKKMNPDAKMIASTGQPAEVHQAELRDLGVVTLLQKPYSASKLLATLHKVIHEN